MITMHARNARVGSVPQHEPQPPTDSFGMTVRQQGSLAQAAMPAVRFRWPGIELHASHSFFVGFCFVGNPRVRHCEYNHKQLSCSGRINPQRCDRG
ncbi:hypothetical protein BCR44DRAFT_1431520 [Catenaria anguillulae PL171]|uniref:Uncharacterized protein n=1 Tax=Catenaria anguillulae PL171 TaxID=765915 RepID=A0A1Y2HRH2_9FUNG|nr:hypothetical protein BCR44DRAFT_1431520 [Catenaria anguillulae PL171]